MYPPQESNTVGVVFDDPDKSLKREIAEALKQKKPVFGLEFSY